MTPFPPQEQRRVVSGLQVGIFVAALDSTLVSVALLSIARDLGGTGLIAWVIAGYTVAATVATPVYGSLSDLHGRQRMMTVAILIYLLACVGCVFAQSMSQLLVLRVLQGLGGGGLIVLAQSTIGDVVPPTERGRYQAWLSGTYALAALVGPVTSGYLTAWFGWRSVFLVSLPLALIALVLTRRILASLPRPAQARAIDYPSIGLLAAGLSALMIALTRIGQGARLDDPAGAALFLLAAALLVGFWRRQFRTPAPVMAPDLLTNPQVLWASLSSSLVFFSMIGGAVMLPLALQTVAGDTPDRVALKMLMHALAVPCGAFFSGRMMPRTMRFRRNMVFGALLAACAAASLALLRFQSPWGVGASMLLMGLGIGISLPPGIVAVQVSVAPTRTGAATAFLGLARSLGSALGLACLTSVLFAALGRSAEGSAAALIREAGQAQPTLAGGFSLVFACTSAALALSALAAMRLPARHTPPGS
jgi:EmrB/QacA subfamily drug resistance transporter